MVTDVSPPEGGGVTEVNSVSLRWCPLGLSGLEGLRFRPDRGSRTVEKSKWRVDWGGGRRVSWCPWSDRGSGLTDETKKGSFEGCAEVGE